MECTQNRHAKENQQMPKISIIWHKDKIYFLFNVIKF